MWCQWLVFQTSVFIMKSSNKVPSAGIRFWKVCVQNSLPVNRLDTLHLKAFLYLTRTVLKTLKL